MEPQIQVFNHSYAIVLQSILFLLVFFDSHVGISLLSEVNGQCTVDNQRRFGAAIASELVDQKADRMCQVSAKSRVINTYRKIGT